MWLSVAVIAGAMFVLWLMSIAKRDASIVDIFWGAGFAVVGATTFLETGRGEIIGIAVALWGARLTVYLWWRNHGAAEDHRYAAMREHHGERFWWLSLFTVFMFQGALILIVAAPIMFARDVVWFGLPLFGAGLVIEAVADVQLARFKANPESAGLVLDRGLWRYSRHPNYFGNACIWWGLWIASGAWWTVFSPLLMTFFLLKVSGVAMLEKTIADRRPGYREYIRRTSAFIPWPRASSDP